MSAPLISVLHPTCRVTPSEAFPRFWHGAFLEWLAACDNPHQVEYVISVHESRWERFWATMARESYWIDESWRTRDRVTMHNTSWHSVVVVKNTGRDCNVDQINCAAAASSGLLIMGTMDDMGAPEGWDTAILETFAQCAEYDKPVVRDELMNGGSGLPWPTEVLIVCGTGAGDERDRKLFNAGASTRNRYKRLGYIVHPEFESMYADNYMTWESRRDAEKGILQIVERLDIVFEHRHPLLGKGSMDAEYAAQNRDQAYRLGIRVFNKLTQGSRLIALCLPGESFSFRYVFSMFKVRDWLHENNFMVEDYGAHTSNVYCTRIELADAVLKVGMDPEFVLWVDDDNVVSPQDVQALIADLDGHPELDWVGGCCWCDTGDYENHPFVLSFGRQGPNLECNLFGVEDWCKFQVQKKLAITSDDVAPDALWSGFPVILMRGAMLKRLGWEAFKPMLGNYHRGFTSEDTTFFYRAHEAGMKGAIDLRVMVPHLKLRGIQPQILPAAERDKVLGFMAKMQETMSEGQAPEEFDPVMGFAGR